MVMMVMMVMMVSMVTMVMMVKNVTKFKHLLGAQLLFLGGKLLLSGGQNNFFGGQFFSSSGAKKTFFGYVKNLFWREKRRTKIGRKDKKIAKKNLIELASECFGQGVVKDIPERDQNF